MTKTSVPGITRDKMDMGVVFRVQVRVGAVVHRSVFCTTPTVDEDQAFQNAIDWKKKTRIRLAAPKDKQSRVYPGLPAGVSLYKEKENRARPTLQFRVAYRRNGKVAQMPIAVGPVGKVRISDYRMARQVAILFRQAHLEALRNGVDFPIERFKNWRKKIYAGTFHYPINSPAVKRSTPGKADTLANLVVELLQIHPILQSAAKHLTKTHKQDLVNHIANLTRTTYGNY